MLNFNLTQSYYVKLKLGYVKNSTQNFNQDLSGVSNANFFYYVNRKYIMGNF